MQGVSNMAKILGSTEHWTQFPNLPPFQSHPNLWTLYGWNWDFWDFRTKTKKKEISAGLFCVNAPSAPPHWIDGITASTKVLPAALSAKILLFSWPNLVEAPKNSFKSCLQHRSIVQAHQKDPSWKRRPTAKQSDFKQQRDTRNFVRQYMRNTSKAFFAFGYFFLPWHFTTNNTNTHLISWFLACGRWTIGFVPEVQCPTHLRIDDLDRIKRRTHDFQVASYQPFGAFHIFIMERFTPLHSRCEGKIWKDKKRCVKRKLRFAFLTSSFVNLSSTPSYAWSMTSNMPVYLSCCACHWHCMSFTAPAQCTTKSQSGSDWTWKTKNDLCAGVMC